jgi:carbonic anhydrase
MVIHHTECLLGRFKQKELADRIAAATGHRFDEELGVFEDPINAIVEDVGRLRLDAHLAHRDKIRGFIYDLAANTVTEVTG